MVRIRGKIWKTGNGYVITIPKNLVEANELSLGEDVIADLTTIITKPLKKTATRFTAEYRFRVKPAAKDEQKRACPDSNVAWWDSCPNGLLIGSWREGFDVTSVTSRV
jgi:antitoxin component of MazEF toxin-antitoxin module